MLCDEVSSFKLETPSAWHQSLLAVDQDGRADGGRVGCRPAVRPAGGDAVVWAKVVERLGLESRIAEGDIWVDGWRYMH